MKKLLLITVYIIFFCITYMLQGMQQDEPIINQSKSFSLFQNRPNYEAYKRNILELSNVYLFTKEQAEWGMINSAEKLIYDIENGEEIKPITMYAQKMNLPDEKKQLIYIPSSNIDFSCNEKCISAEIKIKKYLKQFQNDNLPQNNNLSQNKYIDHFIKAPQHKLLRGTFLQLAKDQCSRGTRRAIFAILKGHNILYKVLNENLNVFIFYAIQNEGFLRDLLDYGIQLSGLQKYKDESSLLSLAEMAVNGSNMAALMLLKKHGIEFNDPGLIDIALQRGIPSYHWSHFKSKEQTLKENLTCLSFLLDQQIINISPREIENRIDCTFSEYKNNYKDFKALLKVRFNARCFEEIILDRIKQNKDKRKYNEIREKIDVRLFDKENMQLLIKMFLGVQTYPDFLDKLIKRIEKNQKKNKKGYSRLLEKLLISQERFSVASGPDIHAIGLWTYFCSEGNFKILLFGYLWLRTFMSGAFSLGFLTSFDLKDQEKQMEKTNQQINLSYLKGYLQGLQISNNNNNLEITNQQNYKRRFEKIGKKQYFQYLAFSLGFSMLTSYALGVNFWALAAMTAGSGGIYISDKLEQFKKERIQKLLDDSLKRGKEDGIARKEFDKEPILAELISPDVVSLTKASLKAIFGNIITFSKKLFGFMSHITEYKIRNRNPS